MVEGKIKLGEKSSNFDSLLIKSYIICANVDQPY